MRVRWLGRLPYREAWSLQRAIAGRSVEDYLLLLEHPHVYTVGVNGDPGHVLVDPASVGADLVHVDRGGDVTYHGPGQLVGYPVRSVGRGPHRGVHHVRQVEDVVIGALVSLGLDPRSVGRLAGYPGVWVGLDEESSDPGPRKICAIGVRTARGRTTHGFALNVDCDLAMFGHIIPCGIADRPVTSLLAEGHPVTMGQVVEAVTESARAVWGEIADIQAVTEFVAVPAPGPASAAVSAQTPAPLFTSTPTPTPTPTPVPVAIGRVGPTALDRRLLRSGIDPEGGVPVNGRKPPWLRVNATMGRSYLDLRHDVRDLQLVTVCEEAGCPNIYECWSDGTATFMINGADCTRACGFCQVGTGRPQPLDPEEPARVAEAVARLGLAHAVITCVARDDLADGGAGAFASVIGSIRSRAPGTTVEVLIADCKGDDASLSTVFAARPDILNHNIETVARLQRAVRPSAGYGRSLGVLARAKDAGLTTKSGLIVGMGEEMDEVLATLCDLRAVGTDIVTVGQYVRPSRRHLPVARWWTPDEFGMVRTSGMAMGFAHVQSSPLTRSSYHARHAAEAAEAATVHHAGAPSGTGAAEAVDMAMAPATGAAAP
jgi:lipoic acid synthetase